MKKASAFFGILALAACGRAATKSSVQAANSATTSTLGITFSESLVGDFTRDGTTVAADFAITATISDLNAWRVDPNHTAQITGTLTYDETTIPVLGTLEIFTPSSTGGASSQLVYRMTPTTPNWFTEFSGAKTLKQGGCIDLLHELTHIEGSFTAAQDAQPAPATFDFPWYNPIEVWKFYRSFAPIDATSRMDSVTAKELFVREALAAIGASCAP
jgi:hypothetical protein